MSILTKKELQKAGFTCLSGPYTASEEDMLHKAINDAIANNKEVRLCDAGFYKGHFLYQKSKLLR
jgi:hypothetical protein